MLLVVGEVLVFQEVVGMEQPVYSGRLELIMEPQERLVRVQIRYPFKAEEQVGQEKMGRVPGLLEAVLLLALEVAGVAVQKI